MTFGFHPESFIHADPLYESVIAIILFAYVLGVVYGTRFTYGWMVKRVPNNVAVYYNRKLIHIFAGGVVSLLFPIFFTAVTIPITLVAVIALITYLPHRLNRILYWFQVKENNYEVNFTVAWGAAIFLSWVFFGNPTYGVIPAAFMSFGDAATGLVRNAVFKRRTKSWLGNVAMLIICVPIGAFYAGYAGMVAGVVASVVEHFEFNPIDDNILITVFSLLTLFVLW